MKKKSKNTIAILTQVNSRSAGGLFNSVKSLALKLIESDSINLNFFSYNDKYSSEDLDTYQNITMKTYRVLAVGNYMVSLNLFSKLNNFKPQVIHQHGIWMSYSWITLIYKILRPKVKTIITPRGMLDKWAIQNSSKKKAIVGLLYENKNLKKADCILALCHSEYVSIRNYGLKNPVAIIPNGVNLPINLKSAHQDKMKEKMILLFIGRIHPKKGLVNLLKGLAIVLENNPILPKKWEIRIAGWSELGHQQELEALSISLGLKSLVKFVGPVYGIKKEEELINADAFILPSFSEGLPMSVLEAWSYKLPVIMTKECNIPIGFKINAAIEILLAPYDIAKKLDLIFEMDKNDLSIMGNNGYELVKEKFTWSKIAKETKMLYDWLLSEGNKPDFIILD